MPCDCKHGVFFRLQTDGTTQPAHLVNQFAGPTATPCWIIGGGPSLRDLPCHDIQRSPAPVFSVNLAGHGLLRPDFWTSYDPSARFHRSTYLDPSIIKFVHRGRATDLVPETTFKVCDCPATFTFNRRREAGFADILDGPGIPDWNDSFLQAIAIAYRLGFRRLYCAGCETHVRPSAEQIAQAEIRGVQYIDREPLRDFANRVYDAGIDKSDFAALPGPELYHFDESKAFPATVNTDLHYFRTAQYLRLSRRAIALAGLQLISVTPSSRLNDYFPVRSADQVIEQLLTEHGDAQQETTRGRYTDTAERHLSNLAPMADMKPHNWSAKGHKPGDAGPSKPTAEPPQAEPPGVAIIQEVG